MSGLGDQADWYFIGAAEEVGTQTFTVDVPKTTSATQTDVEVAEEVAAAAIDTASRMDAGRALLWMGCLGLGFTFLAGAWLMYPKKDAGPSTEAEAEATEGEDEGILPVQDAAVPPGSSGGGAAAKMEGSEALPPAMPRKDWMGAVPTLPTLEPFAAAVAPKQQIQVPGPLPSEMAAPEISETGSKDTVAVGPADEVEDAANRKMALVFAASALFLLTGFKLTRCLGKCANFEVFGGAKAVAQIPRGYPKKDAPIKAQVEAIEAKAKDAVQIAGKPPTFVHVQAVQGSSSLMPVDAENACDVQMEVLQKQKLLRTPDKAEVRVAHGVVRPVPPTSCHIFRILPKQ